jgi:hypothetical protein
MDNTYLPPALVDCTVYPGSRAAQLQAKIHLIYILIVCRSNIYLFYALHIEQCREGQESGTSSPLILLQEASGHPPPPPPKPPPPTSRPAESCLYISDPNQAVCPCTKPSFPAWLSFCYATLLVFLFHIVIKFLVPITLSLPVLFIGV